MTTEMNENKVIWIVDDEVDLAISYQEYLKNKYNPIVFHSVTAAIAAFDRGIDLPELIVSDFKMPNHDGIDLLRELRERNRDIPAVMISGHADRADIADATRFEISGFLEKPFAPEALEELIDHSLQNHDATARATALSRELRSLGDELLDAYELRYTNAENALFEHGIPYPATHDEIRQHIEGLAHERRLRQKMDAARKSLDALTNVKPLPFT